MAKNKPLKKSDLATATQGNHLIEASYRMSVPAKRCMLMLLSRIHPGQKDVSESIRIEAADYAKKTGVSFDQAYKDIKNGVRELRRTNIVIKDRNSSITTECMVAGTMKYHTNQGWLETRFTPEIGPYIHNLVKQGYTTIAVDEALKFSGFYTFRFYELLMQFRLSKERYITIDRIREVFQIDSKQYSRWGDFKRRVIEPSIKEIEDKTEYSVDWDIIKTGRTVTSLMFIFEKDDQNDLFK